MCACELGHIKYTLVHPYIHASHPSPTLMVGIYMKFRAQSHGNKAGMVSNVLVENVYMDKPTQWPIWIGPAQQADEVCEEVFLYMM